MTANLNVQKWVFDADVPGNAKLALFSLIYHAKKDTRHAWPAQDTIAAETGIKDRGTVGRMLKVLLEKGMIEEVKRSGRSVTYRVCVPEWDVGGDEAELSHGAASDVAQNSSRCCTVQHQMMDSATSDVVPCRTNKSKEPSKATNPPTKEGTAPQGEGVGDVSISEEANGMFEEFWASYPDCARKIDKARCQGKYAWLLSASGDPAKFHREVLDSLECWKVSKLWHTEDGKYISSPFNWLDRQRWKDSPEADKAAVARKAKENRTYDWTLCKERCANCTGSGCRKGVKIPPDQTEWPESPETCGFFARLSIKGTASDSGIAAA